MAELIGTASASKDGLMSSTVYSNNSITVGSSGTPTGRLFEIKNYYSDRCLLTIVARDNSNNMGCSIIAFNRRTHVILSKSDDNYYSFYYMGEEPRRYFVMPASEYGSVEMRFMNGREKIEIEDVTDSINIKDLTKII